MIKLVDILGIEEKDFENYKIHFATGEKINKESYNKFITGEFEEWQSIQSNKNFQRDFVISLIFYEKDIWMFAGIYKVNNFSPAQIKQNNKKYWKYDLSLTETQSDLIGKMFVKYKKDFRNCYPTLELTPQSKNEDNITVPLKEITISYILDKRVTINDFDGFDNVNIDYKTLKLIIKKNIPSWKNSLSKVKGIYLIMDTLTGKQYVGSAYGNECIWQRWSEYAKNGHGENIELKCLLENNKEDYKNNFKYCILEICNMNLGNEYILSRENYWKDILMTRTFGLNKN